MSKITAVTRINYDRQTGLVEPVSRAHKGGIPAMIAKQGYTVVEETVMGWGGHNAIVHVDTSVYDADGNWVGDDRMPSIADDDVRPISIDGYWLATITDDTSVS